MGQGGGRENMPAVGSPTGMWVGRYFLGRVVEIGNDQVYCRVRDGGG